MPAKRKASPVKNSRLEVEMKFPVADVASVRRAITRLGAKAGLTLTEQDLYFNHPSRDFRQTDEALRIRRSGRGIDITYKGPKIDTTTKTRREIEIGYDGDASVQSTTIALLQALGFTEVATVTKKRREYNLRRAGRLYKILLDDVQGLGTYVEIETIAPESELDQARAGVIQLAGEMGLERSERRSYLELLTS